jgi:hypothetical protein
MAETKKARARSKPKARSKAVATASRAKVPLVAGGAALAGAAGGIALGAHRARRHRGIAGIDSGDLAKAARKLGNVGMELGELAVEARRARESPNGGSRRSPIEVVLEGLTARRAQA